MINSAEQAASLALSGGVRLIQYRNKSGPRKAIYETALRLARMIRPAGALFIVNDHTDIAAAVDADGIHLGQEDLPIEYARKLLGREKIIGISTHSAEQAAAAQTGGADYIGFGPIFKSSTKDAGHVLGVGQISLIRRLITIPILAIGGITRENVGDVICAGADGAAVISAVLSSPDIKSAAEELVREIQKAADGIR